MKKLFVLAIAAGFFAACNNASSTGGDTTKVDSPAVEAPVAPAAPVDSIPAGDSTTATGADSAAHH